MSDEPAPEERREDEARRFDRPYRDDPDTDRTRDFRPLPGASKTNGMATASLVLGILALCGGITAIPGFICGVIGISRSKERGTGQGLAIAGIVTSLFGMLISIPVAIGLLLPAVKSVRDAASRMQTTNSLKKIGNGMQDYNFKHGKLPPQAICDKNGKKLLSWRVAILPHIEQQSLYDQFNLNEPWDSPNNKPLIAQMPKVYGKADQPENQAKGLTIFKVFAGDKTAFAMTEPRDGLPPQSKYGYSNLFFLRGASNVILCVEADDAVEWTKPEDIDYGRELPLPEFKPKYRTSILVLMGDGRVVNVRKGFRESAMRAAIDPNSTSTESLDQ